jgi:hypothetical protein
MVSGINNPDISVEHEPIIFNELILKITCIIEKY